MTLLWIEGFETFGTVDSSPINANLIRKYAAPINATLCYLTPGRTGKAGMMATTNPAQGISTPPFMPVDTVVVGFAIKVDVIGWAYDLIRFYEGESLYHLGLQIVNSGAIRVNRAGTTLPGESGTNVLAAGQWYYIEFRATIGDTGSYEVRVNGVTVASATGIDTRNGGTGLIDRVQFRGLEYSGSYYVRYDDIYVLNTLGDNNTFLGSQIVEAVYPTSTVRGDWTPTGGTNYGSVDENPTNDDADYVSSNVVGNKDLYGMGSLSRINGNIKGVQLNVDARVTDVAPLNLRPVLKAGGVETPQGGQVITNTGYKVYTIMQEQNPSTSAPWTVAELNTVQAGVEQTA